MNKSLAFVGREKEIETLEHCHAEARHVVLVGPPGIGKTALLRQMRQRHALLLCEETSSLRRICDELERQLGWTHRKMKVVERKNRLLSYLGRRGEPVALDHLALTPPRVARFVDELASRIPVWIGCRSTLAKDIGAVWQHLYRFVRVEIPPLAPAETRSLVEAAAAMGNIQEDAVAHVSRLHRLARGNPRVLEELLVELSARRYEIGESFGLHLLDLDRRIHETAAETAAALDTTTASSAARSGIPRP